MKQTIEYTCSPTLFPKSCDIFCHNQFTVDECIELPDHKPNMHRLVDVKVTPEIESYKFIDSPTGKKVFIKGHLEQEFLYAVDSLCQPVHAFMTVSPFCTFINLGDCHIHECDRLEAYKPKILVEYMQTVQTSCRCIRKCMLLFVWYPKGIISPSQPPQHYACPPRAQYLSGSKVFRIN